MAMRIGLSILLLIIWIGYGIVAGCQAQWRVEEIVDPPKRSPSDPGFALAACLPVLGVSVALLFWLENLRSVGNSSILAAVCGVLLVGFAFLLSRTAFVVPGWREHQKAKAVIGQYVAGLVLGTGVCLFSLWKFYGGPV